MKTALISWDENRMTSIKRDLLFFDKLVYDEDDLKQYLEALKLLNEKTGQNQLLDFINELQTTIIYLENEKLLSSFRFEEINSRYNLKESIRKVISDIKEFHHDYLELKERYLDYVSNYLTAFSVSDISEIHRQLNWCNERADVYKRYRCYVLNCIQRQDEYVPIINNFDVPSNFESKKQDIIQLIIKRIPTPNAKTPLDEIISFRNDYDNNRRYKGLIRWINKMSHSDYNVKEIEEELEYLTLDFENTMRLKKTEYNLCVLEVYLSLPFEIAEKIVKIQWSKIPGTIIKIKKEKLKLLSEESNANGKELAYLISAQEKFG